MKLKKIVMFIIILITLVFIVGNKIAYAVDVEQVIGKVGTTSEDAKIKEIMNKALGVVQVIGIGIAAIMVIALAVKYMTSAPNEKAELKKHAIPYVVGAVIMFGAGGVIGIIRQFAFATLNN